MNKGFLFGINFSDLESRLKPSIDTNFGVEIECGLEDVSDKGKIDSFPKMHLGTDVSIKSGISTEITSDILTNTQTDLKILKDLSDVLKTIPMSLSDCSFQVSIDSDLTDVEMFNFLLLVSVYEKVLYRFSLGKDTKLRSGINEYAKSLRLYLKDLLNHGYDYGKIIKNLIGVKCWAVALKSKKDIYLRSTGEISHIEFRTPNGCVDYELWMNYISTFANMIKCSKLLDTDYLLDELDHMNYNLSYDSTYFNNIDAAIDFANMVFTDETDKLYFIKQYMGFYQDKYKDNKVLRIR